MRLDRLLNKLTRRSNKDIRSAIEAGKISVNGQVVLSERLSTNRFDTISWNGEVLQQNAAYYIALHKPADYLSANRDKKHKTVFDLLPAEWRDQLHVVGRLDIGSTGLLLLTNDGRWARQVTEPKEKLIKRYLVKARAPLTEAQREKLQGGVYFEHEGITTRPCRIEPLEGAEHYRVYLQEGRYRHIRRLFGQVDNQVLALHREAIGAFELPPSLKSGEYMELNLEQRLAILQNPPSDCLAFGN